mgnify:CR=1 FL=1|tara:strand:- start:1500 stop:2480 length:981 start_codon:yes stop_codon:yes gene_type:complete
MVKKKIVSLFVFLCFVMSINAQDTIQVSKKYKTILIFPEDIVESIIGNDLKFNIDAPSQQGKYSERIVKLFYNELAKEKKDYTNYLAITSGGDTYEFILELAEKPDKMTVYIKESTKSKNLNPEPIVLIDQEETAVSKASRVVENPVHYYNRDGEQVERQMEVDSVALEERKLPADALYDEDRTEYYRQRCYYMQFDKSVLTRYYAKQGNVYLWVKGVYYNKNEIYIQFKLVNNESVDLDVNFIRYSIATAYKKYASYQNTELKPVYRFKQPKRVKGKQENHFVVVFSKFSLNENKHLLVELDEQFGNRNMSMEVDSYKINNPVRF